MMPMEGPVGSPLRPVGGNTLPPIGQPPADNTMRRDDYDHGRYNGGSSANTSPTAYGFSSHHSSFYQKSNGPASTSASGTISPPPSRRTSNEEQAPPQLARHSLPSISEALGRDSQLSYPAPPPPPPASLPTSTYFPNPTTSASAEPRRPLGSLDNNGPSNYGPPAQVPYSSHQQGPSNSQQHSPIHASEMPASQWNPSNAPKVPPVPPIRTGNSPPAAPQSEGSYGPPSRYEPAPQSAPPNSRFPYSSYQTQYNQEREQSGYRQMRGNDGHQQPYPSPAALSAPPQYQGASSWRGEQDYHRGEVRAPPPQQAYGESVKRRLDQFDVEASVYELVNSTNELNKIAETWTQRIHHSKNGTALQSIITLRELDEMSPRLMDIQGAFNRLRDMVSASSQMEKNGIHHSAPSAPITNGFNRAQNGYSEDPKPAPYPTASENKRRKGQRAAPPGRCHSCNRAETPEWRRGPDGARTLCNACGLHYAKLTRKNQGLANKAAAGVSAGNNLVPTGPHLRPKGPM